MASFAALAVFLLGAAWAGIRLPWHPILWPVAAFGAWAWAQYWLRLTAYRAATLDGLIQLTACACVFYLAIYAFRDERNVKRAGAVLWVFSGVLGAEALAQFFLAGGHIYWYRDARYGTPVGPFVYHNHFAGCMDLLLPVSIAVAMRVRHRHRDQPWLARVRRGIFPALALASVVVAQSRGGLFALIFEGGLAVLLFWPRFRRDARARKHAAAAAAALVAFSLLAGWGPLIHRLTRLEYHEASALDRARVAATCLTIWRDHPWTGTGFNTFVQVYPQYQSFDSGLDWNAAHNEYAQMLAETGIIGAVPVVAFLLLLALLGVRMSRRHPSSLHALQTAALVGAAGFLFHSTGDFLFHSLGDALLFFALAGIAFAQSNRPQESPTPAVAGADRRAAHYALGGLPTS